jgi:hypothetical protein
VFYYGGSIAAESLRIVPVSDIVVIGAEIAG